MIRGEYIIASRTQVQIRKVGLEFTMLPFPEARAGAGRCLLSIHSINEQKIHNTNRRARYTKHVQIIDSRFRIRIKLQILLHVTTQNTSHSPLIDASSVRDCTQVRDLSHQNSYLTFRELTRHSHEQEREYDGPRERRGRDPQTAENLWENVVAVLSVVYV